MKISQVAAACGCSVRTIRHYHDVGALPEPQRAGNNYREYQVTDLLKAFKVRAIAEAGVPLSKTTDEPSKDLLLEAHRRLDAQEATIRQQRIRLQRIEANDIGAPTDVVALLKATIGDNSFTRHETDMLHLMAFTGVATHKTWEIILHNLKDPALVKDTQLLAHLWHQAKVAKNCEEVIAQAKALPTIGYIEGIADTLQEGNLDLSFSDLNLSPCQVALMQEMM